MPGAAVGAFFDKLPVKMQVLLALLLVLGCAGQDSSTGTGHLAGAPQVAGIDRADDLLPVDCLLPGQVRQLGQRVTYVTRPRPIMTSAEECRIRGGEYVSYDRADYATALKVWLPRAQEGDSDAQNTVGDIYQKGLGLAPEYALAAAWYQKAADQGYSPARINLGVMYEKGLGVPRDQLKALDLYRKAVGLQAGQVQLASARTKAGDTEELAQALRREKQHSVDLGTQVKQLDRELTRLQSAGEDLTKQQAALDAERRQLQSASDQVRRLEAERDRLAAERDRLAKAQASSQPTVPPSPSPAELAQVQAIKQQAIAAQGEVDRARARIAEQQALLDRGQEQLAQRQAELQAKQNQIASLDREIDQLRQESDRGKQEAQQLGKERDLRKQESEQLRKENERLEEKLKQEMNERERQATEERKRLQSAGEDLTKQQAALDAERRKLQSASDQVRRLEAERDRLAAERDRLAKAQASSQPTAPPSPSPAELAQVQAIKQQAIVAQAEVDRARAGIAEQQALLDRGQEQLAQRQAELQAKQNEIASLDREIDQLRQESDRGKQEAQQHRRDVSIAADGAQRETVSGDKKLIGLPGIAEFGQYSALVIGNNNYQNFPKLDTAVADAMAVSNILSSKYGFKVTVLVNANRYQILSGINEMRGKLTDKDNLLIYYAGHGELDRVNQRGNWLPIDAEPDSTANWIPNVQITDILNASSAKHILVISDSCYSGSLTRSALSRLEAGLSEEARLAWIRSMVRQKSRTALTSGGLKPVIDTTGGPHSVFAQALLEALSAESDVIEGRRLLEIVSRKVSKVARDLGAEQVPEYAPIQYAGHAGGEFFFVPGGGRTQVGSGETAYSVSE